MQVPSTAAEVCALAPLLAPSEGIIFRPPIALANWISSISSIKSIKSITSITSITSPTAHIDGLNWIKSSSVHGGRCAPFRANVGTCGRRRRLCAYQAEGAARAGLLTVGVADGLQRKLTCHHRGQLTCRDVVGPGREGKVDRVRSTTDTWRGIGGGGGKTTATAVVGDHRASGCDQHPLWRGFLDIRGLAQEGWDRIYGCYLRRVLGLDAGFHLRSPVGICTRGTLRVGSDWLGETEGIRTQGRNKAGWANWGCKRGDDRSIPCAVRRSFSTDRGGGGGGGGGGGKVNGRGVLNREGKASVLTQRLRTVGGAVGISSCTVNMDARCEDQRGNVEPSSVPTAPEVSPPDSCSPPAEGRVALNAIEKKLFDTLLDTCKRFGLKTQLRVAGGWVRDKLLGKDSIDIDIALDDMMGKEFAEKVNEHLISMGVETTNIGVVQSNPDQSKHLETATTRVHGVVIDFVNLRSEKYAEDSRIPTVEFGTAEQDALRRDLTINSLFYNINTGCVEDFTGRGLDDLRHGIIRAPLDPVSTFQDDPLRVLRAIRFGARFAFRLDDELAEAAANEAIRKALGSKISRERIGVEVELMLKGQDPLMAMRNISRLGLFSTVFALPEHAESAIKFDYGSVCVACLEEVLDVLKQWPRDSFTASDRWICLLGGLLMPLRETTIMQKKKATPVSAVLIREALKLRGKDSDMVAALHTSLPNIRALTALLVDADDGMLKTDGGGTADTVAPNSGNDISISSGFSSLEARQRIAAGLAVRTLKQLWRPALVLSAAAASAPVASTPLGQEPTDGDSIDVKLDVDGDTKIRERRDNSVKRARAAAIHAEAEAIICGLGLDRAWEIKPILDGSSVMIVLGMKSGGPLLGQAMGRVIEWQLANPDGTADELKQWLQQNASSFTRPDTRTRK